MSEATETTTTETETTKKSRLAVLIEERGDGAKLSKKAVEGYKNAYEDARANLEDAKALAEQTVAEAQANLTAAAEDMVRAFGRSKVRLSTGEIVSPTCRHERVFYKSIGDSNVV